MVVASTILLSVMIIKFTDCAHDVVYHDHNAIITCEFNLETGHSLYICYKRQSDFLGCTEGNPPWDLVTELPINKERYSIGQYEIDHRANTLKSTLLIRNVNSFDVHQDIFCYLMKMSLDEDNEPDYLSFQERECIVFPPFPGKI